MDGEAAWRRAVAAGVVAGSVVAARKRQRLGLPPAVTTAVMFAAPAAIRFGLPAGPRRDMAAWGAQMLAYKNAFELPHDDPRRLRRRTHVDYPIAVDTVLGLGMPPGRRLQRALRRRRHLSRLDKALTFFYWTWEMEPHLVMGWLRWRHPERFPAAAIRLGTVFDTTLIGYWSIPSAPPWWASEKAGRMGGDVHRVMDQVARWLKGKPFPLRGDHETGANPFAAMPSDHFASASMTAIILGESGPALAVAGWAYALALAFTLVYLGEHYVVDLLAGLALTLTVQGAWRAAGRPLAAEAPAA